MMTGNIQQMSLRWGVWYDKTICLTFYGKKWKMEAEGAGEQKEFTAISTHQYINRKTLGGAVR
jgi:hypothetical protein